MITRTKDKAVFDGDVERWLETMGKTLKASLTKAIRKSFDEAMLDSKAASCIIIAKQFGLTDLATELNERLAAAADRIVDLKSEYNDTLEVHRD